MEKSNPAFVASLYYISGVEEVMSGNYKDAAKLFYRVMVLNPNHAAANYQSAKLYSQTDEQVALKYAERAYLLDTLNSDFTDLYINLLLANQQIDKTKSLLEGFIAARRNLKISYFNLVRIASELGDDILLSEYAQEYDRNWGYNPAIVNAYTNALLNRKQYRQLEKYLIRLSESYTDEPQIFIQLGKVLATLLDGTGAVASFNRAIAIDSTSYQGHLALSDYYRINNNTPKYLEASEQLFRARDLPSDVKVKYFEETFFDINLLKANYPAVKRIAQAMYMSDPKNAEIERVMLRFMMYTGDLAAAISVLNEQINSPNVSSESYSTLIDIYSYQKEYAAADSLVKIAVARYPKLPQFEIASAALLWQNEDSAGALKALERANKLTRSDSLKSVIYGFRGDILYKAAKTKQAFAAYDRALKYYHDNAVMLNNYAYYLSLEKVRLEDALRMATRACELSENNSTYLDTKAWILYELGRYEEARTVQRLALGLTREPSPELLLHYGDILLKLGDKFLAETYWRRAAESGADPETIKERLKLLE